MFFFNTLKTFESINVSINEAGFILCFSEIRHEFHLNCRFYSKEAEKHKRLEEKKKKKKKKKIHIETHLIEIKFTSQLSFFG